MQPAAYVERTTPGMALARRYEADPRESSIVRPEMDDAERKYLNDALSAEAEEAIAFYKRPQQD
jgi:hypothetical protein